MDPTIYRVKGRDGVAGPISIFNVSKRWEVNINAFSDSTIANHHRHASWMNGNLALIRPILRILQVTLLHNKRIRQLQQISLHFFGKIPRQTSFSPSFVWTQYLRTSCSELKHCAAILISHLSLAKQRQSLSWHQRVVGDQILSGRRWSPRTIKQIDPMPPR